MVSCLHLVFGSQSANENRVQHVVIGAIQNVVISAPRSSILPISSRELLTGAILKLLRRRERSDLAPVIRGPYHARSASHASLGEVHRARCSCRSCSFGPSIGNSTPPVHVCVRFRCCTPFRQVPSFRYPAPPRECTGVDPTQKKIGNLLPSSSTRRLWSRQCRKASSN